MAVPFGAEAFSSEVATGSRQENASKQKSRAPFRFIGAELQAKRDDKG